jgi:hypothetical protein
MIANIIGRVLRKPAIRERLLAIAKRTPDAHIMSPDGSQVYMYRYWLFNQIDPRTYKRKYRMIPFSIRIHHIVMPDPDRHLHDHPFKARTWIMRGGYDEVRSVTIVNALDPWWTERQMVEQHYLPGDSAALGHDQFHKITRLHGGEALTFFVFGRYLGPWGFLVEGSKMLHRDYVRTFKSKRREPTKCLAVQHSDQMTCEKCDLRWDMNDPERPMCKRRGSDHSGA